MRKTSLLLWLLFILAPLVRAQYQFDYANKLVPNGVTLLDYQVVDDKQYSLYEFGGSLDVDPGAATLTLSKTSGNGFNTAYALVALNEDGTYNRSIQFESNSISVKPQFSVLANGEIFVLMRSTPLGVALDPSDLSTVTQSTNGHVIAKYSAIGQLLFSKTSPFYAPGNNNNLHLKARSDGGFTIGLTVRGLNDMDFDAGTTTNFGTNGSTNHLFIGQYSSQAVFQAGVSISLDGSESANIKAFEIDNSGNIYVFGYTKATADLDPSPTASLSIGGKSRDNNYLVKYNANLDFEWGQNLGTGTIAGNRKLALLNNQNVVIGGRTPWEALYSGSSSTDRDRLNLNPRNTTDPIDGVTSMNAGIFLAEYASTTGDYVTSSVFGGTDNSGELLLSLQSGSQHVIAGVKTTEAVAIGSSNNFAMVDDDFLVLGIASASSVPVFAETFGEDFEISGASQTIGKLLITGWVTGTEDVDSGNGVVNISTAGRELVNIGMNVSAFTTNAEQQEICWDGSVVINGNTVTQDGLYTVYSASGLDEDLKTVTTLSEFEEIAASFNVIGTSNGAANGSITAVASGGNGNFTYTINGGAASASPTFSNLSAGNYLIQVFSAGSAISCNESFTVTVSALLVTTSISEPIACNGGQAVVDVSATNGQAPYSYSLDNVSYQSASDFSLTAGIYNIYSKDANNDIGQASITITEPAVLTLAIQNVQNEQCFGQEDGSITLTASGGTAPFTYILVDGNSQSSPIFTGLAAGTYVFDLIDANGCVAAATATITSPSEITTDVVSSDASACNVADGNITLSNTTGGAGNYEYKLNESSFQTSDSFTGLASGIYQVTVKDGGGCTTQKEVLIREPTSITATASFKDPKCFGANDGEASVNNVSGGSGNYTYSVDGINFQQSSVLTGLSPGLVNILIKDDMGCTAARVVFLAEPPLMTVTASVLTDVTCNSGNDGSATISASGGAGFYSYSSDGINYGSLSNQPVILAGLSAGLNTLYAKDLSDCITTVGLMINEPAGTDISVNIDTELVCFGDTNAAITITANSPIAGALEYSLDGTNFGSLSSFTGLAAGDHTAYVKDPNDCIQTFDFTVVQPDLNTATAVTANISCHGASDGSMVVAAMGGTASHTYSIDGTNFQSPNSFQNLSAGSYLITIKDDNDCIITLTETITEPLQLFLIFNSFSDPSCSGSSDGSFSLSGTGGMGAYEYSIDGTNFQGSGTFANLNAGSYNFTIRDANGCTTTSTGQLVDPDVLASTVVLNSQVSCFGEANGSATLTATGGTIPYAYSLDGTTFDNTTGTFNALAAGSHTITTKDVNGCTTTSIITITEPTALVTSITVDGHVTCNGGNDAMITVTSSGGTSPYTYSTDGMSFQTADTFEGLATGTTTITVKDANDCTTTTTVQITEPVAISAQLTVTNTTCNGGNDGSIAVLVSGGTGIYEFTIDGTTFTQTSQFTNLSAGSYSITVKDEAGCTTTVPAIVGEPSQINLNYEAVGVTCNGDGDGQIAGFAQGGTSPYQYSLDGTNFQSGAFSNLTPGNYTLTVKDGQGCTANTPVSVSQPDILMPSTTVISDISCNGAADGEASISVTGGSVPYQYSLDGTTFSNAIDLTNLSPASYTVTIRDANLCESTSSFTITEPDAFSTSVTATAVSCYECMNGTVSVDVAGGTVPYTFALDGADFGTVNKFENLVAGSYSITVKDSQNCTMMVSAMVATPDAISATAVVVPPLCNGGSDGEITIATTGGTGTLEYALDGTNYQSSNSFNGLVAGTYDVTVRDTNACTIVVNATLSNPVAIILSTTVGNALCFDESNGEISITASGGTGNLEYALDGTNFQSSATFTGLAAGNYAATVRDENGCTNTIEASISEPAELTLSTTVVNDNTINITATGGTAPYEYSLNSGSFQAASTFSGLSNGDYSIAVRDANDCMVTATGSLVITSTDDPFNPISISAYPNPVSDYLVFSKLNVGDQIRLVSLNGDSLDLTLITEEKEKYRKGISGTRQKMFLVIVTSKDGRVKLHQKVLKK